MRMVFHNYLPYPVGCVNCGISYTPSDDSELKFILNVPAIYANNFCSRKCKEQYDKYLEDSKTELKLRQNKKDD